ncbi:MAG: YkgJ family cysteine cluster protein [Leptospirales bacterium]
MIQIDVPHELCQECRQCCHFVTPPFLTPYVSRQPRSPGTLPDPFLSRSGDPLLFPSTIENMPVWTCSILDPGAFRCRDWGSHPLDCRIYPLVFIMKSGKPGIGLDPSCPFSTRHERSWFETKARQIRDEIWSGWTEEQKRNLLPFFKTDSFPDLLFLLALPLAP